MPKQISPTPNKGLFQCLLVIKSNIHTANVIDHKCVLTQVQNDLTFGSVARGVKCSCLVYKAQEAHESNDVKHRNEVTYIYDKLVKMA